jgi:hypothetical protein
MGEGCSAVGANGGGALRLRRQRREGVPVWPEEGAARGVRRPPTCGDREQGRRGRGMGREGGPGKVKKRKRERESMTSEFHASKTAEEGKTHRFERRGALNTQFWTSGVKTELAQYLRGVKRT